MKKSLFVILLLVVMAGTIYSSLSPRAASNLFPTANAAPDPLALLPDSDFVALVDIGQLFSTKLFTSISNDPKASENFRKFEADALKFGVDIRQLNQVVVGGRSVGNVKDGNFYAIVTGSFDREKMLAGIAAQPEKVSMQSEIYNEKTIYIITPKSSSKTAKPSSDSNLGQLPINYKTEKFAMSFLNSDMVVVGNIEGVKSTLDVQSGKQPGLRSNQQLTNYISNLSVNAMIRFAGLEPDKARTDSIEKAEPDAKSAQKPKVLTNEQFDTGTKADSSNNPSASPAEEDESVSGMASFDQMFKAVRGGYGSIDLSTGFNLDTTLLIRNETDAKKMYDSLNGLLVIGKMAIGGQAQKDPKQAKLLEVINQVNLSEAGKDIKITVNLSDQLLKEIFAIIESEQKKPAAKAQGQ